MKHLIVALVLGVFVSSANAAFVTYTVEGDVYNDNYSWGVEGSHMKWMFVLDTDATPTSTSQGTSNATALFDYDDAVISSSVTFSNRPEGLSDLTTNTIWAEDLRTEKFVELVNSYPGSVGTTDKLNLWSRYYELKTDLLGIIRKRSANHTLLFRSISLQAVRFNHSGAKRWVKGKERD